MLSPDSSLILWQVVSIGHLLGLVYALVQLYRQPLSFPVKTAWCLVSLFVPFGWVVYLIFRQQAYAPKS